MKKKISEMTLREKIGQTGIPDPGTVQKWVRKGGRYDDFFEANPFGGIYCGKNMARNEIEYIKTPGELASILKNVNNKTQMPLLVSCDAEFGAKNLFDELHEISTLMSLGASRSKELAYKRSYFWAKELKSCGVNWSFGPVCDLAGSFFLAGTTRCISDNPEVSLELLPEIIKGIQDAGLAATAKHFPGAGTDYRDAHISMAKDETTLEEWNARYRDIWATAINSGVLSIMTKHAPFLAVDDSYTRGKTYRPSSASKKVVDIIRKEFGFDGVVITDAVNMKALFTAFEHDDIYIECFNAGNDVILFCKDDYIDIMERAVLSGKVSMKRIDESVERVLKLKEKLGLFETETDTLPLSEKENKNFEICNYEIAQKAITLISDENNLIPLNPKKIKNVTIIKISPVDSFMDDLNELKEAFANKGVTATILPNLESKVKLEELSESQDLIIYACCMESTWPPRAPFFSSTEDIQSLFAALSYGAAKSVVVSFGVPSIHYNYFETADTYLNAYSRDKGTMYAFVDGLFGEFPFTGISPIALKPVFAK